MVEKSIHIITTKCLNFNYIHHAKKNILKSQNEKSLYLLYVTH